MHIVAGEPVGSGDQDAIQVSHGHPVPQPLQSGSLENGTAVAIIAEDVLGRDGLFLLARMRCRRSNCWARPSAWAWRWVDTRA
jgi:hypothetical protein